MKENKLQGKHLFQWFSEHHDLPSQVVEMARALTKDEYQQRDLIAKVWVMLGEEESYMTHEYYLAKAYATIRDRYERYYHNPFKFKKVVSLSPEIQKTRKVFKKFNNLDK